MKNYPTCKTCGVTLKDMKSLACRKHAVRPKGRKWTDKQRAIILQKNKERREKNGYWNSPEKREKLRAANLGKSPSEETRRKMAEASKRTLNGFKKGHKTMVGFKHSEDSKIKMSKTAKTISHINQSGEKHGMWKGGLPNCKVCNKKLSIRNGTGLCHPHQAETTKGKNSYLWKGGITPINQKVRTSLEYKIWRRAVFERDNYQCIWGGKEHGSKLHADHIKAFSQYPELRFAIDNGRTLCIDCHKTTDNYGSKAKQKQPC